MGDLLTWFFEENLVKVKHNVFVCFFSTEVIKDVKDFVQLEM